MVEKIAEILDGAKSIACFVHKSPDGDALGSALAVFNYYRGKVSVWSPTAFSEVYYFLPGASLINIYSDFAVVPGSEVALFVDCGDLKRVPGFDRSRFDLVINVDHHESNTFFGDYNLVNPSRASTSELVFEILKASKNGVITKEVALCLYTGLYTDTGGFKYSNVGATDFEVAKELVQYGVDPFLVALEVYESYPFRRMKLLALTLGTLELFCDGKVAVMFVKKEFFELTGSTPEDTEDFVNYARAIKGVEVAVFIRERLTGGVKVSLRSKNYFNVAKVAQVFGGGGHHHAAGCELDVGVDDAKRLIIKTLVEFGI